MKPSFTKHLQVSLALTLVWMTILACSLTSRTTNPQTQAPSSPTEPVATSQPQASPGTQTAAPQDVSSQPDPLDHLLGLRSIKFNLTITRPDKTNRSLDVAIDSAGNMHLTFGYNGIDLTGMPKDFTAPATPVSSEVFVVDGKAYQPDDQDPAWMTTPFDENYLQTLSQELHGMESPALWLSLLPAGSLQPSGKETVGGFEADKYNVNGMVDAQKISGSIWEEPQSDALVQAELTIPAALFSALDQPQAGEMTITLKAQKADVPPVTLPVPPAATTEPTDTP